MVLGGEEAAVVHRRARAREAQSAEKAERTQDRIGNIRLILALLAVGLLLLPLVTRDAGPWWGLVPLFFGFLALAKLQDRAADRARSHRAKERFFSEGLARFDEDWRKLEDTGEDVRSPWSKTMHFADDLDLFGDASLFQLTSRARTARGRRTLARWMAEPASAEEVRARQDAARTLAEQVEDRAALYAAAAGEKQEILDDAELQDWATKLEPMPMQPLLKVLGVLLPVTLLTTVLVYQFGGPGQPMAVAIVLQLSILYALRRWVGPRVAVLSGPERALRRAGRLVRWVEGLEADDPWLQKRRTPLTQPTSASKEIDRLEALVNLLDARLNVIFALTVGPALMWDLNIVLRAEAWRRRNGPKIQLWFEAAGDLEAISSVAALAFERPDYAWPVLSPEAGRFEAESLQHPLIDRSSVVSNDLVLGGPGSVLLLSGSNMSGKSTLLRSVGLAVVMARSGFPVAARRLVLSPFVLASSVRVVDSLAQGTSHFYAELKRLKHVVDLGESHGHNLLYLLDEVLHGTNSRERIIGAVAVIRWLSARGAVGIVTTHDLGLSRLAHELPADRVVHRHFSDRVDQDRIAFDYRLRDGPIQTTNALRLMKAVGIDVDFNLEEDTPTLP
ncbi:MAG: hypothetical protein ACFB9M_06325 [Myxococcota bacterium]